MKSKISSILVFYSFLFSVVSHCSLNEQSNTTQQKNIIPIFAIAHNPRDFTTPTEIEFWRQFQRMDVGFGATVQLSDNSDNLIDLIVTALTAFNQEIALVITQDAKRIITGLTDVNNQGSIQSGAVYKGVQAGTTKDFLVTLSTATPVAGEKLVLTSPGFGSVVIDVTSNFPCADCAGSPGGALKWDRCDECGGKDACVGCDMVAFSGKVLDQCGVCGGANLCNRACTTGLVDQCGVCGGQNLCLGCDGVVSSVDQILIWPLDFLLFDFFFVEFLLLFCFVSFDFFVISFFNCLTNSFLFVHFY